MLLEGTHVSVHKGETGSESHCRSPPPRAGGATGCIVQRGHLEDLREGRVVSGSLHGPMGESWGGGTGPSRQRVQLEDQSNMTYNQDLVK